MRNYLITGIAGTGKSTVSEELAHRGYRVIEFDGQPSGNIVFRKYRQKFDKRTEQPAAYVRGSGWEELQHIVWKVDPALLRPDLKGPDDAIQFISGYADNWSEFKDDFAGIFLLETKPSVIEERLLTRTSGDWGRQHPEELKHAIDTAQSFNDSLRRLGASTLDAEMSITEIADQILSDIKQG